MASPTFLDFESLIAPVPGDDPAGGPIPFEVQQKLDEARKEVDPDKEGYAPDDPMRPEPKKADWPTVIRLSEQTLTETCKDLKIAARLTEALAREQGFGGLRDGLRLLRRLVEECWDRIKPEIEDGDLEVRAGPFTWLDDPDHGLRFPTTLRMLPLVVGAGGSYSWFDWRQSQDGKGDVSREDFDKAVEQTPRDHCQTVVEDMTEARDEVLRLVKALDDKMGPSGAEAPNLTGIRTALDECLRLVQQILARKGGPAEGTADGEAAATPTGNGAAPAARRGATTRDEAYRQLAEAAATLQRLEPHSPIPYLIQRAVELGRLPFPQLIRALIREPNVLSELNREFGIKEEPPPE